MRNMCSKKTKKMLAIFSAIATTMMFSGCSNSDQASYIEDDNGERYQLIENPDGTETARYRDGREVTFKHDDDGNLTFLSGAAGLLGGLAAGYYLHKGLSAPQNGYYDSSSNRYISRPLRDDDKKRANNSTANAAAALAATSSNNSTGSSSVSKVESAPKTSTSNTTSVKSGFGSAGARSSAS